MGRTKKFLGSRTHGRGMKAGRGAGLRGGRGNAGLNKHRLFTMIKYMPDHFGRHGFHRGGSDNSAPRVINLRTLEYNLDEWINSGIVTVTNDVFEIDIDKLGADKLLGSGRASHRFKIHTPAASKSAVKKVEEAGGEIILPEG